jgi:hypothetical protein
VRRFSSRLSWERLLWFVFGLASAAIAVYAVNGGGGLEYSDELEYLTIADNVVAGHGYAYTDGATAYRPPTWPLLLASLRLAEVPVDALVLLPVSLLVLSAVMARSIAGRVAGPVAGWLCAFGVLLYPLNVYTSTTLYPQALATALLLGLVLLGLGDEDSLRGWRAGAFGLLAVLLVYAVPTMVLTSAAVFIWVTWRSRRRLLGFLIPAVLVALLPVAVWTARNALVFDAFVPVSTATGVNLVLGNSEETTAESGVRADISRHYAAAGERGLDEVEFDAYLADEARRWVAEHPGEAGRLFLAKTLHYFVPYNEPATAGRGTDLAKVVSYTTFLLLLALAASRLLLLQRLPLRPPERLIWLLFLANAPFMAVAFTRARFRQPLDTLLIVEAAIGLALLLALVVRLRLSVSEQHDPPQAVVRQRGSEVVEGSGDQPGRLTLPTGRGSGSRRAS